MQGTKIVEIFYASKTLMLFSYGLISILLVICSYYVCWQASFQIGLLAVVVIGDAPPLVGDEVLAVHVVYDKELEIHFPR